MASARTTPQCSYLTRGAGGYASVVRKSAHRRAVGRPPRVFTSAPELVPLTLQAPEPIRTARADIGQSCVFREYLSVRDYELDRYQVVNNAVYASYLHHARRQYLTLLLGSHDAADDHAPAWALAELKMKYHAPLRSGDRFMATVKVVKATSVRFVTEEALVRMATKPGETEMVVVSAEAVIVSLDENYRPKRISSELLEAVKYGRSLSSIESSVDL